MSSLIFLLSVSLLPSMGEAVRNDLSQDSVFTPDAALMELRSQGDESGITCLVACSGCGTCAECASNACAWVSDVQTYTVKGEGRLVDAISDLDEVETNAGSLSGTCVSHDEAKFSGHYAVVTSTSIYHQIYDPTADRAADMIVLTGKDSAVACPKLAKAFVQETKAEKYWSPAVQQKVAQRKIDEERLAEEQREKQREEQERKRVRDEAIAAGTLNIRDLFKHCKAGTLPDRYFMNSAALFHNAFFADEMKRYGDGPKDWMRSLELQQYNGDFHDPIGLSFEQSGNEAHLIVNDGRHRICGMRSQSVVTEVTIRCSGVTTDRIAGSPTGNLVSAVSDCQRAQGAYDDWKREEARIKEAERRRRENEARQERAGGGFGDDAFGQGY